uniref:Uncharacterized protein LOC104247169 n=1 Tax=Nicotiana sylvestris TaxID=4096 RepID=A0A1U7YRH5_NICSY
MQQHDDSVVVVDHGRRVEELARWTLYQARNGARLDHEAEYATPEEYHQGRAIPRGSGPSTAAEDWPTRDVDGGRRLSYVSSPTVDPNLPQAHASSQPITEATICVDEDTTDAYTQEADETTVADRPTASFTDPDSCTVDVAAHSHIKRRGRGGRQRSLSLGSTRGSSSGSASKGKEFSEPTQEPLVEEIVPNDLSFGNDRRSLQEQVKNLEKADTYPSLITELVIPTVRKDCNWRDNLRMMIPAPNQRISSFRIGFSFVYTYPFTLGFNPAIDPVILEFCRFFKICLAQVGPLVWRAVACLRYLSTKANVNFTFSHLIHLYHPKLFRHGVFTLTARSKKVLVNPEDDKDRGWYCRYVAVRTVDLLGETNIPFPEKWNFAPTMGDVEHVPNFRGFGIRGMTAEVAVAIRASSTASLDLEKTRATLPKRKVVEESSENEEEENTSLIVRPRARRRIIDGDEVEDTPARASISEPVQILSDEDTTPRGSIESIRRLFVSGFESEEFRPVLDETALSSSIPISSIPLTTTSISLPILSTPVSLPVLVPVSAPTVPALTPTTPIIFTSSTPPPSIVPLPSVQHTEAGSSSRGMDMRSVTLEANLIGTELMERISTLEKKDRESVKAISEARRIANETQLEAANWKEHQFEKDKELLECSFSKQLSKASEEIRELKALVEKKEEYAGELVQMLTQAQADLRISSDEICDLKSSHASFEASFESSLAENQVLKNDLAMWEREYDLLEENFNIEVSRAFLNSSRDALIEASQENFDLNSELAKVLETIERTQQPLDFPSPSIEAPVAEEPLNEEVVAMAVEVENVAIPASEGETSMTQYVEVKASVTLASLVDPNISSSAETVHVAASSEVATVP